MTHLLPWLPPGKLTVCYGYGIDGLFMNEFAIKHKYKKWNNIEPSAKIQLVSAKFCETTKFTNYRLEVEQLRMHV